MMLTDPYSNFFEFLFVIVLRRIDTCASIPLIIPYWIWMLSKIVRGLKETQLVRHTRGKSGGNELLARSRRCKRLSRSPSRALMWSIARHYVSTQKGEGARMTHSSQARCLHSWDRRDYPCSLGPLHPWHFFSLKQLVSCLFGQTRLPLPPASSSPLPLPSISPPEAREQLYTMSHSLVECWPVVSVQIEYDSPSFERALAVSMTRCWNWRQCGWKATDHLKWFAWVGEGTVKSRNAPSSAAVADLLLERRPAGKGA